MMVRSSLLDKLKLMKTLNSCDEVMAVMGDATNNVPSCRSLSQIRNRDLQSTLQSLHLPTTPRASTPNLIRPEKSQQIFPTTVNRFCKLYNQNMSRITHHQVALNGTSNAASDPVIKGTDVFRCRECVFES
jgi:hypothetical protein